MARESTSVEEDRTRSDLAELGLKLGLIVMVLVLSGVALAQTAVPSVVALTPAEMKWQSIVSYLTLDRPAPHRSPCACPC
jgi:hypothetical protein